MSDPLKDTIRFRALIPFLIVCSLLFVASSCKKPPPVSPEAEALLGQLAAKGDLVIAKKIKGEIPLDPTDAAWNQAKEVIVPLVSQISVVPRAPALKRIQLSVRAVHNKKELGLLLSWADPTKDEREAGDQLFRDSVAVGFPMNYGEGVPLPYIGMGNKGRPMNIWHWKASWQADIDRGFQGVETQFPVTVRDEEKIRHLTGQEAGSPLSQQKRASPVENLLAEGFGTLTSVMDESMLGKGIWRDGRWVVVVKRKLASTKEKGTSIAKETGIVPISFAVWDGTIAERNGIKGLTRWRFLRFEGEGISLPILKSLVIGPLPGADATRGQQLVSDMGCIACHNLPGKAAVNDVGPDLTVAGAIHRAEYLLESMKDPNAVIVPAPGYFDPKTWTSTMPSFGPEVPEKDYQDITEYLRTLQ